MNYARVELNNAGPVNYAAALRQEICARNAQWATRLHLGHVPSYGAAPVIVYAPDAEQRRHGNFLDASYRAILRRPDWAARLRKVHTTARRCLPSHPHGDRWRELDSCTSSDALLMNIFCYPGIATRPGVLARLGCESPAPPEFGVRARVPLAGGRCDRTEIDMRLGDVLVEAKLTESGFGSQPAARVELYADLETVFSRRQLPREGDRYGGYQLLRNVLAAHATGRALCLLVDARRPDLRDGYAAVIAAIRQAELRTRCRLLSWQELAAALPRALAAFLAGKYGIVAE